MENFVFKHRSLSNKKIEKRLKRNLRERKRANRVADTFNILSQKLSNYLLIKDKGKLIK